MNPLVLLKLVPFWVYPALALLAWGGCSNYQKNEANKALQAQRDAALVKKAQAEQQARDTEYELGKSNKEVSDALYKAGKERAAAVGAADERLRNLAAAWAASAASSPAATACRDAGAPAVAVLPEQDRRDLVALAQEADAVSDRLRACQGWAAKVQERLK